jgi:hypothetical protein
MKLSKEQEEKVVGMFESFWSALPKGNKLAKGNARTAWLRKFKKVGAEEWDDLSQQIREGLDRQEAHRKRLLRDYPDERSQKRANIFIPSRPHPATWINGERWKDEIPTLDEPRETSSIQTVCHDCNDPGVIFIDENTDGTIVQRSFCAWHYTKRFEKPHLKLLHDTLKSIGLGKRKNETTDSWSDRCRNHLKTTKWGSSFGA